MHVMSINTLETKFENMLEEIKDFKKELQIKQINVVQSPVYNDKKMGYPQTNFSRLGNEENYMPNTHYAVLLINSPK